MIGRIITAVAAAIALVAVGTSASAIEIKGGDSGLYVHTSTIHLPDFRYEVSWRIWTRQGKPFVDGKIRWWFPEATQLQLPDPPGGQMDIRDLAKPAWKKIALYHVKLRLAGHSKSREHQRLYFQVSLGIPELPGSGKWSQHAPVSTEWEHLIIQESEDGSGAFLTAAEAKSVLEEGFVVDGISLVDAKLSLIQYYDHILELRADWRGDVMRRTIWNHIKAVERYTRLPTDAMRARLAKAVAAQKNNTERIPGALQNLFDKLNAGIPNQYVAPARRKRYRIAREEAAKRGQRDVRALMPGNRNDGYAAWRQATIDQLDRRKVSKITLAGIWRELPQAGFSILCVPECTWHFKDDGTVSYARPNLPALKGEWRKQDGSEFQVTLFNSDAKGDYKENIRFKADGFDQLAGIWTVEGGSKTERPVLTRKPD